MFKKRVFAALAFALTTNFAIAAIEVNKTDQVGLDGIKGIGPTLSKAILTERTKGGQFKNWADFEKRVKGVSVKKSTKLSKEGLVVNGQSKELSPAKEVVAAKKSGVASNNAVKTSTIINK